MINIYAIFNAKFERLALNALKLCKRSSVVLRKTKRLQRQAYIILHLLALKTRPGLETMNSFELTRKFDISDSFQEVGEH